MSITSSSRIRTTPDSSSFVQLSPSDTTTSSHSHPDVCTSQPAPTVSATEHCFLVGADPSALPFYSSPRVVIANGPAPSEDELKWHDQKSYQRLLNKTTVRCVNILGLTAIQGARGGSTAALRLELVQMHDQRIPRVFRGQRGEGFYCCLFDGQKVVPKAIVAVYLVNPFYSTSLLYRVKGTTYDSNTTDFPEQSEQILLGLLGRKMAAAQCHVAVVTNGHLLIACEAGSNNTLQASSVRILTEAYIDCNSKPYTENQLCTDTHSPVEAQRRGFVRADMMFIWLAVAVHAYHQHHRFSANTGDCVSAGPGSSAKHSAALGVDRAAPARAASIFCPNKAATGKHPGMIDH